MTIELLYILSFFMPMIIPKLAESSIYIQIKFIIEDMERIGIFNNYTGLPYASYYRKKVLHSYGLFRWFYNKGCDQYKNNILYKKANVRYANKPLHYVYLLLQYNYSNPNSFNAYEVFKYCEIRMIDKNCNKERYIMFKCLDETIKESKDFLHSSSFETFITNYICTIFPYEHPITVNMKRMCDRVDSWINGIDSEVATEFADRYKKKIKEVFDTL